MKPVAPKRVGRRAAMATLVLSPIMIFGAVPTPGILMLALVAPIMLMTPARLRMPEARVPVAEILLIAILALSVLWSDVPAYSSERLRTYLVVALATVLACNLLTGREILKYFSWSLSGIIATSLVVLVTQPDRRRFPGLDGTVLVAQFDKNTYGGLLVVSLVVLVGRSRKLGPLAAPGLAVLIYYNHSVTAWTTALVLLASMLLFRRVWQRLPPSTARPVLAVTIIAMVSTVLVLVLTDSQSLLGAVGKDSTLSRRTEIWAACWSQIQAAPLLGHGAYTFLNLDSDSPVTNYVASQFLNFRPPHPHNAVLDLWGQVGLVGLVLFAVVVVVSLGRGVNRAMNGDVPSATGTAVLLFVVLFGVSEPTFTGPWLIVVLIAVGLVHGRSSEAPRAGRPAEQGDARADAQRELREVGL